MMIITKEVELTTAGKVALMEARLNHVRGLNRVYDFRSKANGYYSTLPSIMHDIATQSEAKKQIYILEQQIATIKPHAESSISLEEELIINQTEQELYGVALEVFKHEWDTNTGEYKQMCYNQTEAINRRIAYLSKRENQLIEAILLKEQPAPEQDDDILFVDRAVLEGTLKQLGLCDAHIKHAVNLMTVKAVG